ncbi:peptide-methionine (S)-S-oxide reductase MsrA [Ascidiimonas aurantiaca]|uniref:peptide-methionine (S)-S-oxide reductase MsrA n=1 Tax=Ascidiimonas aurantiaca TaxID=1685432 RepID=UPI0030EF34E3
MKRLSLNSLFTILLFSMLSCHSNTHTKEQPVMQEAIKPTQLSSYETAYFASGCFWCVEAIFESVKGVKEVISGYSGGKEPNPTYDQVGRGFTTHAEAVEVYYDPDVVSFETLVEVFFGSHDPTTLNRQGPDRGPQYRSIAFYKNEREKNIITDYIKKLEDAGTYSKKIVTEVVPFTVFYKAEDYHQDFEKRHPNNAYIRNVSIPRLRKFQEKFPELLAEKH